MLKTLPNTIDALEKRIAELNEQLTQPGVDYAALSAELASAQAQLDEAFELYCEVESKAEALNKA